MPSPLERSSGALPSCGHGLRIRWIGALLLWVATLGVGFGLAARAGNDVANGGGPNAATTATTATTSPNAPTAPPPVSIDPPAAEAKEARRLAADRGDRFAARPDGDGAAATVESPKEFHACTLAPGVRWWGTKATTQRLRRDDAVEESRPVRVAPTRAPPGIARTVA